MENSNKSLAIAYSLKRRAHKMAKDHESDCTESCGSPCEIHMAEGGAVKGVHTSPDWQPDKSKSYAGTAQRQGNTSHTPEEKAFQHDEAKEEHRRVLGEMKSMPAPKLMASGGCVDRIVARRMSEGGMVANGGEDELDKLADGRPNEFDDLALRDDLEFSYDGANSGDELGDDQEDSDRRDIVSRIMRSRAKRDRLPNPR